MSSVILRPKNIFHVVSNLVYFYMSHHITVNVKYINQVLISCVGISFLSSIIFTHNYKCISTS